MLGWRLCMIRQPLGMLLCLRNHVLGVYGVPNHLRTIIKVPEPTSRTGGGHIFENLWYEKYFLGVEKCQIFVFAKMKNKHT